MLKLDLQFFGGRGASSAGGGGGGSAQGELTLPDGSKVEFDGELKYGADDAALTGKQRIAVGNWEEGRVGGKIEYGYAVDADGNPIGREVRGGKHSVRTPYSYHEGEGTVFTHIHPRGDGMLGGSFSQADVRSFAMRSGTTLRAAAKEGTYSMSKTKNFNRTGFLSHTAKADSTFRKSLRDGVKPLEDAYRSKKISYDDYLKGYAKVFNTALVGLHNDYLAGQKQYGYTYTLERRGKK